MCLDLPCLCCYHQSWQWGSSEKKEKDICISPNKPYSRVNIPWVGSAEEPVTSSHSLEYSPLAWKWMDLACCVQSPACTAEIVAQIFKWVKIVRSRGLTKLLKYRPCVLLFLGCSSRCSWRKAREERLQNSRRLICVRIWTHWWTLERSCIRWAVLDHSSFLNPM